MEGLDQYNSSPSIDTIRRYVEGDMSPGEKHEFEKLMLNDPLLMSAVEGYTEIPDWGTGIELGSKANTRSFRWQYLIASGIVLSILLISWWVYKPASSEQSLEQTTQVEQPEAELIAPITETEEESIVESQIIDIQQTDSSVSFTLQEPVAKPVEVDHFVSYREASVPDPMAPLGPDQSISDKPAEIRELKSRKGKIYHIKDYKVADYRGVRFGIDSDALDLGGTPASENLDAGKYELHPNESKVPYVEILEQSITFFATGKYDLASNRFDLILSTYPEDVNAQFYGGLAHYRQGSYQKAALQLQQVSSNMIKVFAEEAEFYLALSEVEMENDRGIERMRTIAASASFYNEQAAKWLENKGLSELSP